MRVKFFSPRLPHIYVYISDGVVAPARVCQCQHPCRFFFLLWFQTSCPYPKGNGEQKVAQRPLTFFSGKQKLYHNLLYRQLDEQINVKWASLDAKETKKGQFPSPGSVVEGRKRKRDLVWALGYPTRNVCYKNKRQIK